MSWVTGVGVGAGWWTGVCTDVGVVGNVLKVVVIFFRVIAVIVFGSREYHVIGICYTCVAMSISPKCSAVYVREVKCVFLEATGDDLECCCSAAVCGLNESVSALFMIPNGLVRLEQGLCYSEELSEGSCGADRCFCNF